MSGSRLVTVLGYSDGRTHELHEICATRLRRAEQEARDEDVVLHVRLGATQSRVPRRPS